jgi:hypothetical protein
MFLKTNSIERSSDLLCRGIPVKIRILTGIPWHRRSEERSILFVFKNIFLPKVENYQIIFCRPADLQFCRPAVFESQKNVHAPSEHCRGYFRCSTRLI